MTYAKIIRNKLNSINPKNIRNDRREGKIATTHKLFITIIAIILICVLVRVFFIYPYPFINFISLGLFVTVCYFIIIVSVTLPFKLHKLLKRR